MRRSISALSLFLVLILLPYTVSIALPQKELPLRLRKSRVSQRQLISNIFSNEALRKQFNLSSDTLKILALRVSFQPDTLDSTTGDGTFQLTPNDTTIIDPPPHNRSYFQAQLDAISHYFKVVSQNKLILEGTVYPAAENEGYTLPHTMDYYHPATNDEEDNQRLAMLLRDAVLIADQKDHLPFSQYDIFVVFHAGVGQDFANDFDTTPNDIPSAFLNFEDLKTYLGNSDPFFKGIETANGIIQEGIILPETENQEGSEFALKGVFVLHLANQLGLPSLFNTDNRRSGIGAWGLMDVGASNYFGLIPAEPCAWSKVFLGWEKPVELPAGTEVRIAVRQAKSAPHIYKIPINDHEYFLIEARNTDVQGDGITVGFDQYGHRIEFQPGGQFTAQIDTSAGERLGVITAVGEYDFAIPGSGILIWHIDESVIAANYESNTVNNDPEHRGVDLEEADGSQDIGQSYGFLSPGSGSEYGVPEDAFFASNEVHKIANKSERVEFSSLTSPSSDSYSGANTGIRLWQFSDPDSVMQFRYDRETSAGTFPQFWGLADSISLAPTIVRENEKGYVFFSPGNARLYAWKENGTPLLSATDTVIVTNWHNVPETLTVALFDTVSGKITHTPLILNDPLRILSVANENRILIWEPGVDNQRGLGLRVAEKNLPASSVLVSGNHIYAGGNTQLTCLDQNLEVQWQIETNSRIQDLALIPNASSLTLVMATRSALAFVDSTGQYQGTIELSMPPTFIISGYLVDGPAPFVVAAAGETIWAFNAETFLPLTGFPLTLPEELVMRPALADIDGSGESDLILVTASRLYAFHMNGVMCNGFPIPFAERLSGSFQNASPLVIANDANAFIIIKNHGNDLFVVDGTGQRSPIKLFSGAGSGYSPYLAAADLNGDQVVEIADLSARGWLSVQSIPGMNGNANRSWLHPLGNVQGHKTNFFYMEPSPPATNSLIDFAYNYPNPSYGESTRFRFRLNRTATVNIKIFDLSGEQVAAFSGSGEELQENEIVWNLSDISDGTYLARFEAADEKGREVRFIKIAVVR